MKKWWKAGLLWAAGLSLLLGGCAGGTEQEKDTEAMGRYLEEEISLPVEGMKVINTAFLADETLRIAGISDTDGRLRVWDSDDGGENWTEDAEVTKNIPTIDEEAQWVCAAALGSEGQFAWSIVNYAQDAEIDLLVYVADPDGNITDLSGKVTASEKSPQFSKMEFTDDGNLMVQGLIGKMALYDAQTGELLEDYTDDYVITFALLEDTLFCATDGQIEFFDWKDGRALEADEGLVQQITADPRNLEITSSSSTPLVAAPGLEEDRMFYCTSQGIFSHVLGGSVTEKVVDGALCSISSSSVGFRKLLVDTNGDFYLLIMDEGAYRLLHYTYSADTPTVPSTTIKLYSLWEDELLRQVIPAFQKQYPDIFVEYEIGISGEDGRTVDDALRNLNTEIMAGKGPDVLMLDGLPASAYEERGLLADIGDVIAAVDEKEGLLENVRDAYEKEGGTYRIAARIGFPAILGDKEVLEGASDIAALADLAAAQKEAGSDTPFFSSFVLPRQMAENWAGDAAAACLEADGSLDEAALEEFYMQLKRLWDLGTYVQPEGAEEAEAAGNTPHPLAALPEIDPLPVYGGYCQASYGNVSSMHSYKEICQIAEETSQDIVPWEIGGESRFIPLQILGISSKSAHIEEAKTLLDYALSKDAQALGSYDGFSVNEIVLAQETYWNEPGNEYITVGTTLQGPDGVFMDVLLTAGQIPEERISQIHMLLETPKIPHNPDALVLESISEEGAACLKGEKTPEEAAQNVGGEVALLLAE